jgi:hypothetical protein
MNNLICIVSYDCIFNPSKVKIFENLSLNDSIFFYTLLFANYIELLMEDRLNTDIIFFLNKIDEEFLDKKIFPEKINYYFLEFGKHHSVFENIEKKYFINYKNILLLHSKTIGIKLKDLSRVFRLLSGNEENVVLGKSKTNELVFSAHNRILKSEFESFLFNKNSFDEHLIEITRNDSYINIMDTFFSFSNFADFKILYKELSTKDSLQYCGESMHERFTNLFIEYKDQLK